MNNFIKHIMAVKKRGLNSGSRKTDLQTDTQ